MKKFQYFICVLMVSVLFSGCASTKNTKAKFSKNNSIDSVIQNEIDKTTATASVTDNTTVSVTDSAIVTGNTSDTKKEKKKKGEKADIDLTSMNSDMIYATVYDLTTKPDDHIGKKIKVKGSHTSSFYKETSQYYHFVLIQDAAACCSQGLEFVLPDDMEYPEENEDITVTGTFETYMEGDTMYCHLVDAVIE